MFRIREGAVLLSILRPSKQGMAWGLFFAECDRLSMNSRGMKISRCAVCQRLLIVGRLGARERMPDFVLLFPLLAPRLNHYDYVYYNMCYVVRAAGIAALTDNGVIPCSPT